MKKYRILNIALALSLCLPMNWMTTSCEDMLEEKPYDFISPDQIEDSDEGADMWVMGCYNVLHTGMFVYGSFPRPLDYDCDYISGAVWQFSEFGSGNFQGGSNQADALWTGMYSLINKCNQAIKELNEMQNLTEAHKNNCLGECYFLGKGINWDFDEAVYWFQKAAQQGNADAQYYLGECYYHGLGVKKDKRQGIRWYQNAARQGHADAIKWLKRKRVL